MYRVQVCVDLILFTNRRRFIVYPAPVAGQCYSFPANLTDVGADQINAIKDQCATLKKGSCMCMSKRLILNDVGILLQNIRRIGHMTIERVSRKLARIMRFKRRSVFQQLAVLRRRLRYRKRVMKNRMKVIFDSCQRNATRSVEQWIGKHKPRLYKRLHNPRFSWSQKRRIRFKFVKRLRAKELSERIMAVLDARYVRVISASYVKMWNRKIEKRIKAARTVYGRFTRKTKSILNKFSREVKHQIKKDIKKLRERAEAYIKFVSTIDENPAFNVDKLVNMTTLQQSYKQKQDDVMDKFSWFDPTALPHPYFNETNEYRFLNRAMTEIFSQVLNTRKDRYATFKEKHDNLNKLYKLVRTKLRKMDAGFSDYIRGANVMPMPLLTKKYGFHYPKGMKVSRRL